MREDKQAPVIARRQSLCQVQGMTEHKGLKKWIGFGLGLGEQSSSLDRGVMPSSRRSNSSREFALLQIKTPANCNTPPVARFRHRAPDFINIDQVSSLHHHLLSPTASQPHNLISHKPRLDSLTASQSHNDSTRTEPPIRNRTESSKTRVPQQAN